MKSPLLLAQFDKRQEEWNQGATENKIPSLVKPCPTRWCSIKDSCESVLGAEHVLRAIVTSDEFLQVKKKSQKKTRTQTKRFFLEGTLIPNLKKIVAILKPIDELIVKFQSDSISLSEVFPELHDLTLYYTSLVTQGTLNRNESSLCSRRVKARKEFLVSSPHEMSYLLDPRFFGSVFTHEEQTRARLAVEAVASPAELTDFLFQCHMERESNTTTYTNLCDRTVSPLQFWTVEKRWTTIQPLAKKLFSLMASSASSERNFSALGFIHTKLRNRLSQETVNRLCFVRTNYTLKHKTAPPEIYFDTESERESESESEEEKKE